MSSMPDMNIDKEIDARGSHCPGPMMELIRAIKSMPVGSTIALLSTDPGSQKDIPLWLAKAGHEYIGAFPQDNYTRFIVRKTK